jgi:nicotinamide mononucleotide (NMN) deamidase PncC
MLPSEKIQEIHNSRAYGNIIEVGAGVGISNYLLNVPGASNTVKKVVSPYSRDVQIKEFGVDEKRRSVSKEVAEQMLWSSYTDDVNLVVSATSQVGKDICNHGWIVIYYDKKVRYYHVTSNDNSSRQRGIDFLTRSYIDLIQLNLKINYEK